MSFGVAVFLIIGCAKIADPSPLREDYLEASREALSNIAAIVKNRDSVGVQKFDEVSWFYLPFRGEVDTTSGGIRVFNTIGREVPFVKTGRTFVGLIPGIRDGDDVVPCPTPAIEVDNIPDC